MVDTSHVKTINILSFIIIAFGFFNMVLLFSGLMESGGFDPSLFNLWFFNIGLNMEITFLVFPAFVMVLLRSKSVKVDISLNITRIVSFLSVLIIAFYMIFQCLGLFVAEFQKPDPNEGVTGVMSLFMAFFAIEAALHLVVFWMANKSLAR